MELTHDLLLAAHFLGLFLGGASGIGLPVIGAATAAAPAGHRGSIAWAVKPLKRAGHAGLGLLIVTGLVLVWRGGVLGNAPVWFWIKMAAVLGLIAGIVLAGRAGAKAMAGDAAAAGQAKRWGVVNLAAIIVIVVSATLAFH